MCYRFVFAGILAIFLSLVMPVVGPFGQASIAEAQTISNIVVEGNQRVETDTVLSYLQVSRGDPFDSFKIDESVKALFQTGLFADVQVSQRGSVLVIHVEENPMINRVNFEGNSEIKDAALAKEVELHERMMFTRAKVQSDTARVIALYRRSGYYSVTVSPKIIRRSQNRVDLVYEIHESGKTTVQTINFVGNKAFSDSNLRGVIGTAEHSWWKFFARNDTYDPDRVEYDKELLRRYYLKNGFADVRVVSADAVLTPDRKHFNLTYTVDEGPQYSIADVAVNLGNATLDPSGLKAGVKTGVGDKYDASKVDKTVENLTLEAARQGFVFANVNPQINRNDGKNTLNITYNIVEGPRTYIERIDIVGNTRTEDRVIRRELQLYEGDAFNRVLIERARRRLTALDFFDKIDFREEPGSAPDKIVLVVDVTEKSTGSINFSIGYSSAEQVIGSISLQERNFLGRGQDLKLNSTVSFRRQSVDFSFTEPYFLGLPMSAGVDMFATHTDNTLTSSYKSNQVGGALRGGFRLDEYSSMNVKYGLAYRKITGVDAAKASPAVIESQGSSVKSSVGLSYIWDDLDNPLNPTSGFRGEIDSEVAGLGGDVYTASLETHGWYFLPVYEESVVLKIEGNAGHMLSLNSSRVPVQDRFYKGSDTFRGFALSGVGPHQIANDGSRDSIGGTSYAIGTLELTFPTGLPDAWGVAGEVFSDFGTVFGAPEKSTPNLAGTSCNNTVPTNCTVFDSMAFRASIGAGLIWQSPFGPLRFEAAYPILKAKADQTEWFRFSIGTRF
jgi:outer membrane protein insertion porin family